MGVARGATMQNDEKRAREAKDAEARLNDIMQSRFMAMFDDEKPSAKKASTKKKGGRAIEAAAAAAREEAAAAAAAAEEGRRRKAKKSKKRHRDDDDDDDDEVGGGCAKQNAAASRQRTPKAGGATTRARDAKTSKTQSSSSAAAAAAVPTVVFGGDRPMLAASRQQAAASGNAAGVGRAKKLFMSFKVGLIHEVASNAGAAADGPSGAPGASTTTPDGEPMGEVTGLTGASLNDMRREVQRFGAQGLGKWDKRALEQRRRVELGAKAEKGPRIPANIGIGLWRKNEEREEKKRVEEFEMGGRLVKKKRGLRKADTPEGKRGASGSGGDRDKERGLAWGSGSFKGGVLTLRKSDMIKEDMRLNTRISLGGGKLAGREYGAGAGKGSKGAGERGRGKGGKKGGGRGGGGKAKGGRPSGGGKKKR